MRKARPLGELAVEMNPQKELIDALQAKVSAWVAWAVCCSAGRMTT